MSLELDQKEHILFIINLELKYRRFKKAAIEIGKRALSEMVIKGIETNIPLHLKILEDNDFVKGNIHTGFIENF